MAHERIQLVARIQRARHFVAAEIEGANDQRMRLHLLGDLAISLMYFSSSLGSVVRLT